LHSQSVYMRGRTLTVI